MLQIIVGLLGIYIGLAISFEKIVKYLFHKYPNHDLTQEEESRVVNVINWFAKTQNTIGIIGFIVGLIIFIAPTPTIEVVDMPVAHVQEVTQRFIGDLIPAIFIIMSSLVLNNTILSFFNFRDKSFIINTINFINKYSFWIGLLTILVSFLHLILGSSILF